ncbi:phage virion morphogenesis protein [Roseovarius mucosus]|uniref:Phage virion morphogenesis family protein n=1 Tax=Roseovarius mucosus TaxID=215743 RepID=A0A1V0RTC9_9RHOB|nr:phage virion morphogenesis protein [Roseovarius mucosus]ARE84946.1 phage virion morphogenesis family protein [Roseovarius mucosus]MBW4975370.1 phage virion morphogenesis protein [Roseovarius mucosus]
MVTLTVSLDSLDFDNAIANGLRQLSDLTPLMQNIGTVLETSVSERFEKGEGPGGIAWPISHRAREFGGKTLVDSTRLRDSIVTEADSQSARIGTNVPYAPTHQFGAFIEPKAAGDDATAKLAFTLPNGQFIMVDQVEIPARPFLGFDDKDETDIVDTVEAYLREVFA